MAQRVPTCLLTSRLIRLVAVFALVMALSVAPHPAVAAGPWFVDATTGNDADDCLSPATACMTIQAAVDKASSGDTINVAAGVYFEPAGGPLTINKTLTLLGAQATVDARFARGAESDISDPQGVSVAASDVVIDGFTIENSVLAFPGFGIWLNAGISGTQILNNIIEDNIVGIALANLGPSQAVISHNWIRNNTRPGAAQGSGIYTDQFSGGPIVRNVLIDQNAFTGHSGFGAAINISNTDFATGGVVDLTVTSNLFDANSRAFVLFNTHDSTFDDNTITNSTFVASADVRIFDGNSRLTFTNNDLSGGVGHAIRLSVLGFDGPSSDVEFHQNNIEFYGLTGLTVDNGSHTGTVDATCNWWNSPSGPFASSNPSGTGEEVVGDANFTPWLIARAPGGPCIGPAPTSGKGTGGGQVQGASFGFNAQVRGGVSSGHFQFNEKGGPAHHCDVTLVTFVSATKIEFDVSCNPGNGHVVAEDNNKQGSGAGADRLTFTLSTRGGTLTHGQITVHN